MDAELKRRNIRLAWILAGVVAVVFVTALPFWQGLLKLALSGGL